MNENKTSKIKIEFRISYQIIEMLFFNPTTILLKWLINELPLMLMKLSHNKFHLHIVWKEEFESCFKVWKMWFWTPLILSYINVLSIQTPSMKYLEWFWMLKWPLLVQSFGIMKLTTKLDFFFMILRSDFEKWLFITVCDGSNTFNT